MKPMTLSGAYDVFGKTIISKYSPSQVPKTKFDLRDKNTSIEFEIRFGLKDPINKMDFERVYNNLLSHGFIKVSEEYHLKIITDNTNRIRSEINNLTNVREFCKTNIMPEDTDHIIKENIMPPSDNTDFNFRISIQKEYKYVNTDPDIIALYKSWGGIEKSYRYMTRIKLQHPEKRCLCVDLSIVKSSKNAQGALLKEGDFGVSQIFNENDTYEIEVEINDFPYLLEQPKLISKKIAKNLLDMKDAIKYISAGFQGSNFPISLTEKISMLQEYNTIIGKKPTDIIDTSSFIGPSSFTLQKTNLIQHTSSMNTPCILNGFCVTDKADGDRKLLFISLKGRVYFITMGMNVQYTGATCMDTRLHGTIVDGEHILYDKHKSYINLYAAFDLYFINKKDVRKRAFISESKDDRYVLLEELMLLLHSSHVKNTFKFESDIEQPSFIVKKFYPATPTDTIQDCCAKLFKSIQSHTYPYETDGIIFTSTTLGVAMDPGEDKVKNYKYSWKYSLKWKPPEFNTIDFLIRIKRIGKQEDIEYINKGNEINSYKILNLFVGYNEKKDGLINPQKLMFDGVTSHTGESSFSPVLFSPSSPIDQLAHICYVPLKNDSSGEMKIFTENNEPIDTDIVIEFRYDVDEEDRRMAWKPLRIRYDKTDDFRKKKGYGNAYHVANNNWHTIHNPVTQEMLTDNKVVILEEDDDDVYYNQDESKSKTQQLKTFHNICVKKLLIDSVCKRNTILIDFAVGRGGDLNKWIKNKVKFVLGIDISKDNIHNPKSGVCSRYIGLKKKGGEIIDALFIHGDTSKLILNGDFAQDDDKEDERNSMFVIEQVMGNGTKTTAHDKYVTKLYGVASNLFDVGSIQFAVHYMFKDINTIHNFLKNCSDMIKVDGYLIGTCYDGESVFKELAPHDEAREIYIDEKKVWAITKKYDAGDPFTKEDCLGYTISVYQESINKEIDEYLVHFPYFIEMMGQYGFIPHSPNSEINPIDTFESIYKRGTSVCTMTPEEQHISFLNKYFMFKKVRNVATAKIHEQFTQGEDVSYIVGEPKKMNVKIVLK